MKKIICLFLSLLLILSIVPISVFASERTVITEINAYFNFTMPSYGDAVDRTSFEITVEGDIPVTISTDNFDWYIEKNGNLFSIRNGYFTDGLWCFDVYVELNDSDNYTFDYENGTTLKINDVVWCTDIESDGWVYSPSFKIEHIPGKLPLDIYTTKYSNVPISYVGTPIEPYDFSIEVIGGTKPYTFSKSGGPDWLQISQDGILSGTPVSPGTNDPIYVTVTDALGAEASLAVSVKKTHIASSEREKISKIEATIDLPEFYCGYNIENSYPVTVTEGSPAVIATNNSDFYYVDIEGNKGDSTKQLVAGKFTMDFKVEISGEDGYNYTLDKENLEIIINGQPARYENIIVNKDISFVWVTIPPFEVDHIFDNDTDATCNGCDFTREGCDHQYDNACDNSCNVCSATRSTKHQYDAVCDDECNVCKEKRIATPHTFDNCNDGYCNVCNFYRSTPSHSYDDCNDVDCNLCGTTRNVPVHSYSNFMDDSCNICGETRTINTIALNEKVTAIVEVGGTIIEYIFTPSFTGEFAFEAFASSDTRGYIFDENEDLIWEDDDSGSYNQFKIQQTLEAGKTYLLKVKFYSESVTGEIPFSIVCVHDFDDDCDDSCGICGLVREAPHSYDNAADKQCNECGNIRELNFIGLNETKVVEITTNIEYVDFVFIPVISGKYSFIGLGDENQDTFAELLDSEGNVINSNDDSAGNRQFMITYDMEAGKTYILRACFYNNNNIGAFSVTFICEHSYDDGCDVDCNVCSTTREAPHEFNNGCDDECDNCGHVRTPEPHKYTNCEDSACNICGAGREAGVCVWDGCFDGVCNVCENERTTPSHEYTNHLDTECNYCGISRELNYITLGETINFTLLEGEVGIFVFICENSGKYAFGSSFADLKDAFGSVHTTDDNQLTYDDDGGVESSQFYLEYDFEEGKTYILKARFYSENESGDCSVSLFCVEHSYDDEFDADCNACGYHREAEKNVNVVAKGNIDYTVLGNIVIVENNLACKVGYIADGKYVNVSGTKNPDSTYSYTVPDGVAEVILLTKGDVDSNNEIDATDYLRIKGHFLGSYNFDAVNFFAGDVTNEGEIDATDYLRIKGHFLGTYNLHE